MIIMPRALAKIAYWVCIGVVSAALCGCAETTYPSLPSLPSSNDSLLSPAQQEKTIKDLSAEKSQTGEEKGSSGR
jgi:hypothetical protein